MAARALMVLGTASNVGKSLIVAALCRHFAARGVAVAPFKAQNMSLNSAATPEGLEIGRAQALQAEAAFLAPSVDMNPVLIKPTGDAGSQIVVNGRIWGSCSASEYYGRVRDELFGHVSDAYARLANAYDLVVIEGAGSPAEINLRDGDIVNMAVAHLADARCVLVGDIDRGGVFAALLGTLELLDARDRARIDAFVINKFRGDRALLQPGIEMIEPRLGISCAGVVGYLHDVGLEEEDGVALEALRREGSVSWRGEREDDRLRVAVVALPLLSNFTDFDTLAAEPSVDLRYVISAEQVAAADVVILPGSKHTLHDLRWIEERGIAAAVRACRERALVVGICGGMQMLGASIADPEGIEGGGERAGLGLLPIATRLAKTKVTVPASGTLERSMLFGVSIKVREVRGYEIHVGGTIYEPGAAPFARITRQGSATSVADGATSADGCVLGTYLHGVFCDDDFRHDFIRAARARCGLPAAQSWQFSARDRNARIDRLAEHVASAVDVDRFFPRLYALR